MSEFEQLCLALDWWRSEAEHSAAELRKMGDERAALVPSVERFYGVFDNISTLLEANQDRD